MGSAEHTQTIITTTTSTKRHHNIETLKISNPALGETLLDGSMDFGHGARS